MVKQNEAKNFHLAGCVRGCSGYPFWEVTNKKIRAKHPTRPFWRVTPKSKKSKTIQTS